MANILVIGANRGIGYFMVERLLQMDNSLAVLDIDLRNLDMIKEKYPNSIFTYAADCKDIWAMRRSIQEAYDELGSFDVAIYNACIYSFESEADTRLITYENVMDTNYFGAVRMTKLVLPYLREQGAGRIIFTSSTAGVTGFVNLSPYASSKGAIESFAKCMELENKEYGISFHLFHPPLTETASAAGLGISREYMEDAKEVGYGLAEKIWSKKFIICNSFLKSLQINLAYRYPLFFGRRYVKKIKKPLETRAKKGVIN